MIPFTKNYELLVTVKLSYGTEENFYVQVTMSDLFYNSGMFIKEELFRESIKNAVKKNLINPVESVKSVHVTPFKGNKMLFRAFPNMTFL